MIKTNKTIEMKILNILLTSIIVFANAVTLYADEWSHIEKGARLEENGKYSEAIKEYEQALKLNPNKVYLYSSIGNIYERKFMNIAEAIDVYTKGLEIDPQDYALNFNIMHAYFKVKEFEKGIKHYKILSEIRGENDTFTFPQKALQALTENMGIDETIEFYRKFVLINPSDTTLREKLASLYMDKNDYANAKVELKQMLKQEYHPSGLYFNLGVCSYYLGEYKEANDYLLKAQNQGESVPKQYFDMVSNKIKEVNGQ